MTAQATPRHRVTGGTAQMRAIATDLADASVWSMDATETAKTLVQLAKLAAQVAELEARVAAHADDLKVGEEHGATSTAAWLAVQTRTTRPAARLVVSFGHDLDRHVLTRKALAAGDVGVEQARVIIEWVEKLPDDLDPEIPQRAEALLVEQAAEHDAKILNTLGKRILDVVAPEVADAQEAKALEREERAAMAAARFTMADDGHGQTHGRFTLPSYHGAALRKMLLALSAPKHLTATEGSSVAHRPGPEKLGRAFCELIERIPAKKLPQAGGLDATVVVLIDEDALFGRLEIFSLRHVDTYAH